MMTLLVNGAVVLTVAAVLVYTYKTHKETRGTLRRLEKAITNSNEQQKKSVKEIHALKHAIHAFAHRKQKSPNNRNIIEKEMVKELISDLESEGLLSKNSKQREKDIIIIQEFIHHNHAPETSVEDMTVLLDEAREYVKTTGIAATNFLEKHLAISEEDAETLLDRLEEEGIVGPPDGSSHRRVFIRE